MESVRASPLDRTTYCRTCMERKSGGTSNFVDFQTVPMITEMLTVCTTLQLNDKDGLPEQMCTPCLKTLTTSYEFKKQCEKSDDVLRKIFAFNADDSHISITIKQEPQEIKPEVDYAGDDDDFQNSDYEPLKVKKKTTKLKSKRIKNECKVCSKTFNRPNKLTRHMSIHLKAANKEHPCDSCSRVFDRASKLERHVKVHDPDLKPYECDVCSKRFKRESLLLKHLITHPSITMNGDVPVEQRVVEPEVEIKSEVMDNIKTEGDKFNCEQCLSVFDSNQSLSAHMKIHRLKNRVLACFICKKVFKKTSHLKRHERTHEDNKPYKCHQCNKKFAVERQLLEHINKHKGLKPHLCPVCSKAFAQMSTLNAHLRVHTREKPYLCATCGKRFDSSTNLNQHLKRHRGEKTFYCTQCPGRYVSKGELQSHMSTHTGARPFVCDTCGSAFTKTNSLAKHKLIHLGIKPHECDVCAMRFNSKDHLKRHYRIHTGEKPYKCEFCDRAFTQSNDLVKHTRSHLGDKMYRCTMCPEGFRLKTELRKHISVHFVDKASGSAEDSSQDKTEKELKQEPGILETALSIVQPMPVEVITEINITS